MPSLKEIKTRIASVKSTRKITSAMKMVASSKLHHAQTAIQNMLPYENMLEHILKAFLVSVPDAQSIYDTERSEIKHVALIVYSSNGSLCGGYNGNVIRKMMQTIAGYQAQGVSDITIYPIGRKVAEAVAKLGVHCAESRSPRISTRRTFSLNRTWTCIILSLSCQIPCIAPLSPDYKAR